MSRPMSREKKSAILYLEVGADTYWAVREAATHERMSMKEFVLARLKPDIERIRREQQRDTRSASK